MFVKRDKEEEEIISMLFPGFSLFLDPYFSSLDPGCLSKGEYFDESLSVSAMTTRLGIEG